MSKYLQNNLFVFQVENVLLEIPFPKSVLNMTLTPSQGKYSFDPVTKVMTWDVGKIDPTKLPNIRGSINLQSGAPPPDSNPTIQVSQTAKFTEICVLYLTSEWFTLTL